MYLYDNNSRCSEGFQIYNVNINTWFIHCPVFTYSNQRFCFNFLIFLWAYSKISTWTRCRTVMWLRYFPFNFLFSGQIPEFFEHVDYFFKAFYFKQFFFEFVSSSYPEKTFDILIFTNTILAIYLQLVFLKVINTKIDILSRYCNFTAISKFQGEDTQVKLLSDYFRGV